VGMLKWETAGMACEYILQDAGWNQRLKTLSMIPVWMILKITPLCLELCSFEEFVLSE
jgi:hypothetical protein